MVMILECNISTHFNIVHTYYISISSSVGTYLNNMHGSKKSLWLVTQLICQFKYGLGRYRHLKFILIHVHLYHIKRNIKGGEKLFIILIYATRQFYILA